MKKKGGKENATGPGHPGRSASRPRGARGARRPTPSAVLRASQPRRFCEKMYQLLLLALVPLALGAAGPPPPPPPPPGVGGEYSDSYARPTAAPTSATMAPTATAAPTRTETYAPTRMTEAPSYAPTTDTYAPTPTAALTLSCEGGYVMDSFTIRLAVKAWLAGDTKTYCAILTWCTGGVTDTSSCFVVAPTTCLGRATVTLQQNPSTTTSARGTHLASRI